MMNNIDVIRAWKDEEYRLSLSEAERAQLPAHPAGLTELKDQELAEASGGTAFVIFTLAWGTAWGTVGIRISMSYCK